jgi:methionine-rich copper-binding protein CopC
MGRHLSARWCGAAFVPLLAALTVVVWGSPAGAVQDATIAIAFRALSDGLPVLDLSRDEISIAIDGNRHDVRSLELVAHATAAEAGVPPPYVTNATPSPRRRILIYADEESLSPGDQAEVHAGIHDLAERLAADDHVGLMSTRPGGMTVAPTADRARLHEAAASLSGLRSATNQCVFPDALRQFLVLFRSLPNDTPTTVLFFSGGVDPTWSCDVRRIREDISEVGRAARAGALDFYVVHVFSRSGQPSDPALLQDLAGSSDATFLRLVAGRTDVLSSIVTDTAAYYVARVAVPAPTRDGSAQRLEVATGRARVQIRAQDWIRIAPDVAAAPGVTAVSEVLRSPGDWRALELRALTLISPNPGDSRIRLLSVFQAPEAVELSAAMIGVFEPDGTTVAQWSARATELAAPLTVAALPVAAGRYRVRVAAASVDGRVGTVDQTVDARVEERGGIGVSSLVLAILNQGAVSPTLVFAAEPAATVYLELSGVPSAASIAVRLEVLRGDGTLILEPIDATVRPGSVASVRVAHAQVPLGSIPPGDYLVRGTVLADDTHVATRSATLRKVLR